MVELYALDGCEGFFLELADGEGFHFWEEPALGELEDGFPVFSLGVVVERVGSVLIHERKDFLIFNFNFNFFFGAMSEVRTGCRIPIRSAKTAEA